MNDRLECGEDRDQLLAGCAPDETPQRRLTEDLLLGC